MRQHSLRIARDELYRPPRDAHRGRNSQNNGDAQAAVSDGSAFADRFEAPFPLVENVSKVTEAFASRGLRPRTVALAANPHPSAPPGGNRIINVGTQSSARVEGQPLVLR